MQIVDLVTHKLRLNTYWEDYYRFGFYRRDMPWSEKALYLGDYSSYYWPWEFNSLKFDRLFIRKTLHKAVLDYEGLPTSRILMKAGHLYPINSADKFAAELAKIEQPFVTKLDGGGGGLMNMMFEPEQGRYRGAGGLVAQVISGNAMSRSSAPAFSSRKRWRITRYWPRFTRLR